MVGTMAIGDRFPNFLLSAHLNLGWEVLYSEIESGNNFHQKKYDEIPNSLFRVQYSKLYNPSAVTVTTLGSAPKYYKLTILIVT